MESHILSIAYDQFTYTKCMKKFEAPYPKDGKIPPGIDVAEVYPSYDNTPRGTDPACMASQLARRDLNVAFTPLPRKNPLLREGTPPLVTNMHSFIR